MRASDGRAWAQPAQAASRESSRRSYGRSSRAFSWMLYGRVKDPAQREINRELFRFMTSASLLMDENIVMRFRKIAKLKSNP